MTKERWKMVSDIKLLLDVEYWSYMVSPIPQICLCPALNPTIHIWFQTQFSHKFSAKMAMPFLIARHVFEISRCGLLWCEHNWLSLWMKIFRLWTNFGADMVPYIPPTRPYWKLMSRCVSHSIHGGLTNVIALLPNHFQSSSSKHLSGNNRIPWSGS